MKKIKYHPESCVACFTCEVACKQEHNLPVNTHWIKIFRHPVYEKDGRLIRDYSAMQCQHCDDPQCMAACPEDAIYKGFDESVLIREELCSGCGSCIDACPFDAMGFDDDRQLAAKCTQCVHLLEKGAPPACVKHCPTSALQMAIYDEKE